MPTSAPTAYKFCETHFKANCPLCATAVPNPDLNEVVPTVAATAPTEGVPPNPTPTPPPPLTDPKAQKIVEAARKYANAVEAAAIISDQLKQAEELVAGLKKKLDETRKDVEDAMKETRAL